MVQVYVHRIRKYLGSYLVLLKGKVDAIIFSAGVGENSAALRYDALANMEVGSSSACRHAPNTCTNAKYMTCSIFAGIWHFCE